jgi:hypothetical protein
MSAWERVAPELAAVPEAMSVCLPGPALPTAQHAGSLLGWLAGLQGGAACSDLTVVCCDGWVASHRLLLAACSRLLAGCLAGPLEEEGQATLILPGATTAEVAAFHASLFCYGATPAPDSLDSVLKILATIGVNIGPFIDIDMSRAAEDKEVLVTAEDAAEVAAAELAGGEEAAGEQAGEIEVKVDDCGDGDGQEQVLVSDSGKSKKLEYVCLFCEKRYRAIGPYERHLAQHRDEARAAEGTETTTFTLDVNENDEIVSSPRLKCEKCLAEFHSEADYSKHGKIDCTKSHLCTMCNKCFSSTQTLSNHIKLHTKELEFTCELCEKQFVSRSVLGNHMKTHDAAFKIPRFNCLHCPKKFTHPSNLKRHVRTAHFEMSDKRTYDCSDCSKSFRDPSALKHHAKTHLEVRPFPCPVCPKSFGSKTQLENHQRIHTGEKPFLCNLCGRCFVTKGQLKSHKLNRHVGVKYQKCHLCPECGQSFVKEFDLRVHMRKHTGERPFACHECGKTFRSERNLVNHSRIHTGDKPYRCETCAKCFASCAGLRQHFKCHAACRLQATEGAYCRHDKK